MKTRRFEIVGLLGFVASGLMFSVSAVRNGDAWALAGSIAWILACAVWLVPLVRRRG